jgi:hypothetical protein
MARRGGRQAERLQCLPHYHPTTTPLPPHYHPTHYHPTTTPPTTTPLVPHYCVLLATCSASRASTALSAVSVGRLELREILSHLVRIGELG